MMTQQQAVAEPKDTLAQKEAKSPRGRRAPTAKDFEHPVKRFFLRRRFIVDKDFQVKLLLGSMGWFAFSVLVIGCVLFAPLIIQLNQAGAKTDPGMAASGGQCSSAPYW